MVGRMLRGWMAMFKLDVQEKMEQIVQAVEFEANLPPRIIWTSDASGLALSTAQLLEASSAAIMDQCNLSSALLLSFSREASVRAAQ